jgi:hypothetical protein
MFGFIVAFAYKDAFSEPNWLCFISKASYEPSNLSDENGLKTIV